MKVSPAIICIDALFNCSSSTALQDYVQFSMKPRVQLSPDDFYEEFIKYAS